MQGFILPTKSILRLKALALTVLEKIGLEFFSQKGSKNLSIFSPKIRDFLWGQTCSVGTPNHPSNHPMQKNRKSLAKISKINQNVQKCHFFTVMKLNIIAIYVVKLKAVLCSQFLTNLDKIWYVQVSTQGTFTYRISSRSVQKQKSFFLCSTFTVK